MLLTSRPRELHTWTFRQEAIVAYAAKILADHLAPSGERLTTFEVTFPRIILSEYNTHRSFSRNSASSRAIPIEKMIARVQATPFVPTYWGKNQKGMQAHEELDAEAAAEALATWCGAAGVALSAVARLNKLGVHKQLANRLLEPFMWHTALVTATEYQNFFALRCHPDAQPEIRTIACMMRDLYESQKPGEVEAGFCHMPLITDVEQLKADGFTDAQVRNISVGRCARVSYLTHDGKREPAADLALCEKLLTSRHMSPFEHVAYALDTKERSRNFTGWKQYRAEVES